MRISCLLTGLLLLLSLRASASSSLGGGSEDGGNVHRILSRELFEEMLTHRNDFPCPGKGFYTYDAFILAAKGFPEFGNTGNITTRKREIAAFFAQTSHETTGGWLLAPDGPYTWGYCYVTRTNPFLFPWWAVAYCTPSVAYPCAPFKQYYGRGPFQLTWNYYYGQCGKAIGVDLLDDPDLLATDPVISFKSAIWLWMTPQYPKPSSHNVITGEWSPSETDLSAKRLPGYGLTTNIINGGIECGKGPNPLVEDRIGFYKRYCDMLGVDYGDNLDCYEQWPFGFGNNKLTESM